MNLHPRRLRRVAVDLVHALWSVLATLSHEGRLRADDWRERTRR